VCKRHRDGYKMRELNSDSMYKKRLLCFQEERARLRYEVQFFGWFFLSFLFFGFLLCTALRFFEVIKQRRDGRRSRGMEIWKMCQKPKTQEENRPPHKKKEKKRIIDL